ncbi:alpha/beta hydrolase [Flavobacterium sp. N2270]|uniref:alpha/beta hydrolase n=1 Tax=Flavobacterium sp. N2270 TaxID=2986831 RepID=UPI00222502C8|nr:alpha/beta hydrolase [Flavobacterium sp. N2270]
MKLKLYIFFLVAITFSSCNAQLPTKHIFYLHGRIIEQQGKNAVSEQFGKYELDSIIAALKVENGIVHAEIRNSNVDYKLYAIKVSKQIDELIKSGVEAKNITVIGASKGAIIACNISSLNTNAINYVFLAGNNDYQEMNNEWKFHGKVLCIYDSSDDIAGKNYDYWKAKDNFTTKFEQIELKTNLGHGFIYKPLSVWMEPTKKWIFEQRLLTN